MWLHGQRWLSNDPRQGTRRGPDAKAGGSDHPQQVSGRPAGKECLRASEGDSSQRSEPPSIQDGVCDAGLSRSNGAAGRCARVCALTDCQEPGSDAGSPSKPRGPGSPDLARTIKADNPGPTTAPERGVAMKSINRFAEHADRSRSWVYQMIRAGNLEAVRVGKRYVITAEAERAFYAKVAAGQLAQAAE
jgi:hypothetical protein